jgi:hypothetical protein
MDQLTQAGFTKATGIGPLLFNGFQQLRRDFHLSTPAAVHRRVFGIATGVWLFAAGAYLSKSHRRMNENSLIPEGNSK